MSHYAIIENGTVSNLIEWDGQADLGDMRPVVIPDGTPVGIGWAYDGTFTAPPAPPAPPLTSAECEIALQQQLDGYAVAWGYDNLVSAASYAASTVAQFAAEAKALISCRDASWVYAEGLTTLPASVAAFLANAPAAPDRPKA